MATTPDELWTPQDVADYCKVPLMTVYKWNSLGEIPYFRLGKHARYKKSDVLRWVESKSNLL